MKKGILIIILCLCFTFFGSYEVKALSGKLSISANSSVTSGSKYSVSVKYSGDVSLGSISIKASYKNATCSVSSTAAGAVGSCTGSTCNYTFSSASTSGYGKNVTLLKFSCSSKTSPATFNASVVDNDAWDNSADLRQILVSSGSKSIKVGAATTKKSTSPTTTKKKEDLNPVEPTTRPTVNITTTTTTTKKRIFTEPITTNIQHIADDFKLKSLKIVGYDLEFDKNKTGYSISVPSSIDELYVIAEAIDPTNMIENAGVVNIKDEKYFLVRVFNENADTEVVYKIDIDFVRTNSFFDVFIGKIIDNLFIIVVITAIILFIIFFRIFKKKRERRIDSEDDEHYSVPQLENAYYKEVSITTNHFIPKEIDEIKDNLMDAGIKEIPETEEELTRVFVRMNKDD